VNFALKILPPKIEKKIYQKSEFEKERT